MDPIQKIEIRLRNVQTNIMQKCILRMPAFKELGMHTSNYLLEYHKNMFRYIELEGA